MGGRMACHAALSGSGDRGYSRQLPATGFRATLPNALTALRVVAIPLLVLLFYAPWNWAPGACSILFGAAAVTDWLDGYLARRWHVSSAFGAFLDPVADKLMVGAVVVLLPTAACAQGQAALLSVPAVILTLREILVSALREWMATSGQRASVQVGFVGKCKTAVLLLALTLLLATSRNGNNTFVCASGSRVGSAAYIAGVVLLHLGTVLAVASAAQYLLAARPVLAAGWNSPSSN